MYTVSPKECELSTKKTLLVNVERVNARDRVLSLHVAKESLLAVVNNVGIYSYIFIFISETRDIGFNGNNHC